MAEIGLGDVDVNEGFFYFQVAILGLVDFEHCYLVGFLKNMHLAQQSLPDLLDKHFDLKLVEVFDLVKVGQALVEYRFILFGVELPDVGEEGKGLVQLLLFAGLAVQQEDDVGDDFLDVGVDEANVLFLLLQHMY